MLLNCLLGASSVVSWLIFFSAGLLIDSQPYRNSIKAGSVSFGNVGMVLITYTITNVSILCCLSSIVGAATRILVAFKEDEVVTSLTTPGKSSTKIIAAIFTGLSRGFFIYLLLLAGVYLSTNTPFNLTTPEQYARMAGTVSVMSFLVNYEPTFFKNIIAKAL